jgi:ribosomal protein L37AE/L43A
MMGFDEHRISCSLWSVVCKECGVEIKGTAKSISAKVERRLSTKLREYVLIFPRRSNKATR